jgi:hypothetical protein
MLLEFDSFIHSFIHSFTHSLILFIHSLTSSMYLPKLKSVESRLPHHLPAALARARALCILSAADARMFLHIHSSNHPPPVPIHSPPTTTHPIHHPPTTDDQLTSHHHHTLLYIHLTAFRSSSASLHPHFPRDCHDPSNLHTPPPPLPYPALPYPQ